MSTKHNTKNYEQQGGATWTVGGTLDIAAGGKITADGTQAAAVTALKTTYTTGNLDTEAEIITALNATNTAVNAIITALNGAGILAAA